MRADKLEEGRRLVGLLLQQMSYGVTESRSFSSLHLRRCSGAPSFQSPALKFSGSPTHNEDELTELSCPSLGKPLSWSMLSSRWNTSQTRYSRDQEAAGHRQNRTEEPAARTYSRRTDPTACVDAQGVLPRLRPNRIYFQCWVEVLESSGGNVNLCLVR
jgi:hypothetical protein